MPYHTYRLRFTIRSTNVHFSFIHILKQHSGVWSILFLGYLGHFDDHAHQTFSFVGDDYLRFTLLSFLEYFS